MGENFKETEEQLSREELKITRHNLCSIDLSDIEENLTIEDETNRADAARKFYKEWFKRILSKLTQAQLEFTGKKAQLPIELTMARGTINGFVLLEEWFNEQIGISEGQKEKDKEMGPEPGSTGLPEI